MAEVKHYLDHAGLAKLISLIKAADLKTDNYVGVIPEGSTATTVIGYVDEQIDAADTNLDNLIALVGAGELEEGQSTILARLGVIEGADTVTGSIAKALKDAKAYTDDEIDALDAVVDSADTETTKGTFVNVTVTEEDGVITAVAIDENDIASAALLGELTDAATANTAFGKIAAEEAARKAQIGELGKVSEEEGAADHTVKSYVDAKVAEINDDADELTDRVEALEATHATKEVEGKTVFKTVAEEADDRVTQLINGAPEALDTLKEIADWIANQDKDGVTDATTLVSRVDANTKAIADEVKAREDAIDALDATLTDGEEIVSVQVVQTNGKLTGLTVTSLIDACGPADVAALWAAANPENTGHTTEPAEEPQA